MYYYGKIINNQYEPKLYPNLNEIVFVKITSFSSVNTYCELLEYNNLEGFIPQTGLDKRVSDPTKQFEYNTIYPLVVTMVEEHRVDLSYKNVHKDTRIQLLTQFANIEKLYSMLKEFCYFTKVNFETAQKYILFPKLNTVNNDHLNNAENYYMQYLSNPHIFFEDADDSIKENIETFIENMKSRLTITNNISHQQFKLKVTQENSLAILKLILSYCHDQSKLMYVSSPKYQLVIETSDEFKQQEILNDFLNYIAEMQKIYSFKFELGELEIIQKKEYNLRPLNMTI